LEEALGRWRLVTGQTLPAAGKDAHQVAGQVDGEGERGEPVQYFGSGETSFSLRQKQSNAHPVPFDRYAVGIHHVAFAAPSREAVDERAAWLRDTGAEIESGPQDYDYSPGYYAVFFYDPDGLKLEVVHVPAQAA